MKKTYQWGIQHKFLFIFIQLVCFAFLYILSTFTLKSLYVPSWTAKNFYWFIWIGVIIFSLVKLPFISLGITIGNILGVVLGELLQKEIPQGSGGTIYELSSNGWLIWILTIIITVIIGSVMSVVYIKKKD